MQEIIEQLLACATSGISLKIPWYLREIPDVADKHLLAENDDKKHTKTTANHHYQEQRK